MADSDTDSSLQKSIMLAGEKRLVPKVTSCLECVRLAEANVLRDEPLLATVRELLCVETEGPKAEGGAPSPRGRRLRFTRVKEKGGSRILKGLLKEGCVRVGFAFQKRALFIQSLLHSFIGKVR